MLKIINGKKYDTRTATEVAEWSNNLGQSDFRHCTEILYRKRTGEFFVYGSGGAMSAYSRSVGTNCWTDGHAIVPFTLDEAKSWVERNCDADDYVEIFGDVEE